MNSLDAPAAPKVVAVNVDDVIHPVTTEIVGSAIALAKRENAALLIIRLNTPGGLMDAMRDTIAEIESSPVPVVTYVAPSGVRAASAGFFILESGDVAAMAPGTNTGAAHPVAMGGEMDAVRVRELPARGVVVDGVSVTVGTPWATVMVAAVEVELV